MAASEAKRIRAPEPPEDLAGRKLPVGSLPAGPWIRLHDRRFRSPLHWSRDGRYRFDSAQASFGVFYSARDLATAFLEVFADKIRHSRRVAQAAISRYDVYAVQPSPEVRVVSLEGTNLVRVGATLGCFSGSYPLSQRWGAALMAHPDRLDGLVCLGRRSGAPCLALFGDDTAPRKHQAALTLSRIGRLDESIELWQLADALELGVF